MNDAFQKLKGVFDAREATVGIIGLGYVGLPLALEVAEAGHYVIGYDVSSTVVERLNAGISHIKDVDSVALENVIDNGCFEATTDERLLKEMDAILICVPTPLDEYQNPDMSYIQDAMEKIRLHVKRPTLIVLESTTYPGTTDELIVAPLMNEGFLIGENMFVCYSPERVDPGNANFQTKNTPKVLGGTTARCLELGVSLYSQFINQMVPVSDTKTAEMSKLLENTFRSVNIAFMNEMALMSERLGINIWEVIDAAKTKPFGFMPFYPGPGIGGHCIPLDPMYLSWKAKEAHFFSNFIETAQATNLSMHRHVVSRVIELLNVQRMSLNGAKVLLLGMAYKADIDDLRESPALEIYELLRHQGAEVSFCDPYVSEFRDANGEIVSGVANVTQQFAQYDALVLLTEHGTFDYKAISRLGVPILDTRNGFAKHDAISHNVELLGMRSMIETQNISKMYQIVS